MLGRLISLMLFACMGVAAGWVWADQHPQQDTGWIVLLAIMLALGLWMLLDAWRGTRVVAWLRSADFSALPSTLVTGGCGGK